MSQVLQTSHTSRSTSVKNSPIVDDYTSHDHTTKNKYMVCETKIDKNSPTKELITKCDLFESFEKAQEYLETPIKL